MNDNWRDILWRVFFAETGERSEDVVLGVNQHCTSFGSFVLTAVGCSSGLAVTDSVTCEELLNGSPTMLFNAAAMRVAMAWNIRKEKITHGNSRSSVDAT